MALTTKTYRLRFKNVENTLISIEITDKDSIPFDGASVEFIDLIPSDTPYIKETINNGDDLLQTIFGTKCTYTFKNTPELGLSFFSSGEDGRFSVYEGVTGFRGFLVMDDNSEPYLPPGQNVTLVATDGLGLLKNIELSTPSLAKMRGKYRVIEYVYNCLLKTGNNLEIYVMNNLFEDSMYDRTSDPKNCPFDQSYIDALTFEKEVNVAEDCYTVLDKILFSWGCRLTQYMGAWWIMRMDEYKELNSTSFTLWNYTRYVGGVPATGYNSILEKTIDTDLPTAHVARHQFGDVLVSKTRPYKSDKTEYRYEFPIELIKNIDFQRGGLNSPMSGGGYTAYFIDNWILARNGNPVTCSAFRRRAYDSMGYVLEDYVILTSSINNNNYIISEVVYSCAKDRFKFSVDRKLSTDVSGSGYFIDTVAQVRLYGDDGTFWTLDNGDSTGALPEWVACNSTFTTNQRYIRVEGNTSEKQDDWVTADVYAPAMPVTGQLFVLLYQSSLWGNGRDTHINNITFEYIPYINGQYTKFTGESYEIKRPVNPVNGRDYTAKREEQLFMADAPCKPYKGAMFTLFGGTYFLTTRWEDWRLKYSAVPPVGPEWDRFAAWQARSIWNHYRLTKRLFQGTWKGIDSSTAAPMWIVHRINITTVSEHNLRRKFIFLSMRQDVRRCTYEGVLAEIDKTDDPRDYTINPVFKYLLN